MIDFHSHILPGIDDGSKNAEESIGLLRALAVQGVDTVVATPHFYPDRKSVNDFLSKRSNALEKLREYDLLGLPEIIPGAEVRYYDGIRRMEGIELLCAEGSRTLLLEMPFEKWSEMTIKEVATLARSGRVKVVLAHIERYLPYQNPAVWERLFESGVMTQVNAGFFTGFLTKRKAFKMLANGSIHVIGSDCHNLTSRPPEIGKAALEIEKRFGRECLDHISRFTRDLLCVSK